MFGLPPGAAHGLAQSSGWPSREPRFNIDQINSGMVQPDGTLNLASIAPGDRVVELRKDGFKSKQFKKHFAEGTPVILAAPDTALEVAPAELKNHLLSPDAQVTLAKQGEASIKVSSGGPVDLSAGTYTLAARTSDGLVRTSSLEIAAWSVSNARLVARSRGNAEVGRPGWLETGQGNVHAQGRRLCASMASRPPRAHLFFPRC